MPKLGLTMEEGTIAEWLVADGQSVEAGTAVLRIETDKTETDVEAASSGRLHLVGAVGDTYTCGELIGWFLADGEEPPGAAGGERSPATAPPAGSSAPTLGDVDPRPRPDGERRFASPNAHRIAAERGIDLHLVRGTGPGGRIVSEDLDDVSAPPAPPPPTTGARASAPATAAARHLADLLGVDLAAVATDPVDGRVTREAVAIHVRGRLAVDPSADARPASTTLLPATQEPREVIPFTGIRGTIASRMHGSLEQMAQLTLFMDADLRAMVDDREARKSAGAAPSYTDYVIAAVARALVAHPRVNAQVTDQGIAVLPEVHVGMAVALDEGLIVPVVRDTVTRDLTSLSTETARLADAARAGNLDFAEIEGGTFSVSTLGMFGVDGFTPVINPPNAAILGVGRLRDDVVVGHDGGVTTVARVTLSLTWDHRVFDGAPAAEFARTVCDLLQRPDDLDRPAT
ncbi:MAG: dihydrolipoamide acetyltransferase family protein [Ilumatobacteraceae bacterium]